MEAVDRTFSFKVYNAGVPVSENDVRALKEFLQGNRVGDEIALHHLFERHPSLIGVLGFSEFASEHPLYKRNADNRAMLIDKRTRDRADLLAARESIILPAKGKSFYKSVHIVELKSASMRIAARGTGQRLSHAAAFAENQLKEYRKLLTEIPENRKIFESVGWDIRFPTLHLIMGSLKEFQNHPGQLEEVRGFLLNEGVLLCTVDELLARADMLVRERRSITDVSRWSVMRPIRPGEPARLLLESEQYGLMLPASFNFRRSSPQETLTSRTARLAFLRSDFLGFCAYCRLSDNLLGSEIAFVIDRFRPAHLFPELSSDYSNLYYACPTCARTKAALWPTPEEAAAGYRLYDPTADRFIEHFEETMAHVWKAKTKVGEYSIGRLHLNRPQLIELRCFIRSQ